MADTPAAAYVVFLDREQFWELLATEEAAADCVAQLRRHGQSQADYFRAVIQDSPTRVITTWRVD